jgi:hypothetical protein
MEFVLRRFNVLGGSGTGSREGTFVQRPANEYAAKLTWMRGRSSKFFLGWRHSRRPAAFQIRQRITQPLKACSHRRPVHIYSIHVHVHLSQRPGCDEDALESGIRGLVVQGHAQILANVEELGLTGQRHEFPLSVMQPLQSVGVGR